MFEKKTLTSFAKIRHQIRNKTSTIFEQLQEALINNYIYIYKSRLKVNKKKFYLN